MASTYILEYPRHTVDSSPELSIVIVNWNSLDYLRRCLKSLPESLLGIESEIIVVDNASRDNLDELKIEAPWIHLLISERNLGFAGANNLGFRHCSGDFLLFINPDTTVIGSAIGVMLACLKGIPEAAIVGCRLLNGDGSVQTSCIQRFPTLLNKLLDIEYLRLRFPQATLWGIGPLFSDMDTPAEVDVVSGACMMITRDAFAKAGGFNEEYFMYAEDVDLCYRVRQLGGKAFYVGQATVTHYGGGSSARHESNQWAAVMQRRATLQFLRQHRGSAISVAYRAAIGIAAIVRLAAFALLAPFRTRAMGKGLIHSSPGKWIAVFKWAVGLDGKT